MEKFRLHPGELLLVNDPHVTWMKGGLQTVPGQLKLTNKRLVFVKDAPPFSALFALVVKSLRSHVVFDWKIAEIRNVTRTTHGRVQRITIDPGFERPKEFAASKVEVLEFELKRLTGK